MLTNTELLKRIKLEFKSHSKSSQECYITDCSEKPIHSHSISLGRYIKTISDEGRVLFFSNTSAYEEKLVLDSTGKKIATTFPGFCKKHDQMLFKCIDNEEYSPGRLDQSFLLAMRASAREYTVRKAWLSLLMKHKKEIDDACGSDWLHAFKIGMDQLSTHRIIFNRSLANNDFWRIKSNILIFNSFTPIVATGTFKLEYDQENNLVNDVTEVRRPPDYPLFLSILPSQNKTHVIISWFRKHNHVYNTFSKISELPIDKQQVIITNMLCTYLENFAIKPTYFSSLSTIQQETFKTQWKRTMRTGNNHLIISQTLNFFS